MVVIEEVFERSWSPLVVAAVRSFVVTCSALKDAPALMISSSMRGRGGSCHACAMTHQVFHSARQLEMALKTMGERVVCLCVMCERYLF